MAAHKKTIKASKKTRRTDLLETAMTLLRPLAKAEGVSQEKYLVGLLKGKYAIPHNLAKPKKKVQQAPPNSGIKV